MTDATRPNDDACPQLPAEADRQTRIRLANDFLRATFQGGRVAMTAGIAALDEALVSTILQRVQTYTDFNPDNDPHGEHDMGFLTEAGQRVMWKIDYYDKALRWGSPDPADPTVTTRVLTILLSSEY